MPTCPGGASWVNSPASQRGGWCVYPDGRIVNPDGSPIGPLPPVTQPPIAGIGGLPSGVPGGGAPGASPYTSYPGTPGVTIPTNFGGGGAGATGSHGTRNALISGGISLLGSIFNFIGKKRETDAANRNAAAADAQTRADLEKRAHAGAGIYSNMLNYYGHGDLATPEQLYEALLRPPSARVQVTSPSLFGLAGNTAEDIGAGASDYFATKNRNQPQAQSGGNGDILMKILEMYLNQGRTPSQGGGFYDPNRDGF